MSSDNTDLPLHDDDGMSRSKMRILSHEVRNRKIHCGDLLTRLEDWIETNKTHVPVGKSDNVAVVGCLTVKAWIMVERRTLAALSGGAT